MLFSEVEAEKNPTFCIGGSKRVFSDDIFRPEFLHYFEHNVDSLLEFFSDSTLIFS